jgi:hypothetical protein
MKEIKLVRCEISVDVLQETHRASILAPNKPLPHLLQLCFVFLLFSSLLIASTTLISL